MSLPTWFNCICPHCCGAFECVNFSSGFCRTVRIWSDGYREEDGRNLDSDDWKVCPYCARLVSLLEAESVPYPEPPEPPPNRSLLQRLRDRLLPIPTSDVAASSGHSAPTIKGADVCDLSALRRELDGYPLSQKTERQLRLIVWRLVNHPFRPHGLPADWTKDNLQRLLPLMTGEEEAASCILHVEMLRQLGRFDDALTVANGLPKYTDGELSAVECVMNACREKHTEVFELPHVESTTECARGRVIWTR